MRVAGYGTDAGAPPGEEGNARLEARAHERERVGRELGDAGGQHARAQDGVGRGGPLVLVQQALLADLEHRNVHARVWQDADLRAPDLALNTKVPSNSFAGACGFSASPISSPMVAGSATWLAGRHLALAASIMNA